MDCYCLVLPVFGKEGYGAEPSHSPRSRSLGLRSAIDLLVSKSDSTPYSIQSTDLDARHFPHS